MAHGVYICRYPQWVVLVGPESILQKWGPKAHPSGSAGTCDWSAPVSAECPTPLSSHPKSNWRDSAHMPQDFLEWVLTLRLFLLPPNMPIHPIISSGAGEAAFLTLSHDDAPIAHGVTDVRGEGIMHPFSLLPRSYFLALYVHMHAPHSRTHARTHAHVLVSQLNPAWN